MEKKFLNQEKEMIIPESLVATPFLTKLIIKLWLKKTYFCEIRSAKRQTSHLYEYVWIIDKFVSFVFLELFIERRYYFRMNDV